jgi:sec-independent protein translocase protein TatB
VFGIGGSEILVILVIAMLFLGPDKLPDAAKQISKVVRDLKKQSRVLQQTVENDEHIGGAIRDLKSALRGDEIQPRPPIRKPVNKIEGDPPTPEQVASAAIDRAKHEADLLSVPHEGELPPEHASQHAAEPVPAKVTLPHLAGEADGADLKGTMDASELAALIKPPVGETVGRAPSSAESPVESNAPGPAKLEHD